LFRAGSQLQQQDWQMGRDKAQNDFQLGRDKQQFDWKQQEAEAARQQGFLDEARKQSSRFILDAIDKGEFDPGTARELRQNLVAESEVLGNPRLDATQRAEAIQKLRAQRSMLLANRAPKAPEPTPQEQFDQGVVTGPDGAKYRRNSKGDFEPLPVQPQQPAPPATADDAFKADPKLRKQYIDDAVNVLTEGGTKSLTVDIRKQAAELARELYDNDNPQPAQTPATTPAAGQAPPAASGAFSPLLSAIQGAAAGITGQTPATIGQSADIPIASPDPGRPPAPSTMPAQNQWADVATPPPPAQVSPSPPLSSPAGASPQQAPATSQSGLPQAEKPDFGAMVASAKDDADRAFVSKMQGVYEGQSPAIQSAISVLMSPDSLDEDAARALAYLKENGIDIDQLAATPKLPKKKSNRDWQSGKGM